MPDTFSPVSREAGCSQDATYPYMIRRRRERDAQPRFRPVEHIAWFSASNTRVLRGWCRAEC